MMRVLGLSLAASLLSSAHALTLHRRDAPAVVGFDVQRRHVNHDQARDLLGRDDQNTVRERLINTKSFYFCNITLGTPGQELGVVLDTGSSDLWCNVAGSDLCQSLPQHCSLTGAFDPDASKTFSTISSDFNITYADGTSASGDYVSDKIRIGDATIDDFQFALGFQSSSKVGVLGIGYPANEVQVQYNNKKPYANLPKAMVQEGLINSNAYSLWLNDLSASTGSILFGGVDAAKYLGELETLPVQRVNGKYAQLIIVLTELGFASESQQYNFSTEALPIPVLLDSGSTLTYLPNSLVSTIYSDLRVTYDTASGNSFVPCSLAEENINITYTFSSPRISVPVNELVINAGSTTFRDGTPACLFGITPAGGNIAILGDTFLRSAYVVYDLANNEISLATTNFNSQESHVLEIGTGPDAVPTATHVPNPVTSVSVAGDVGPRIGGPSGTFTGGVATATAEDSARAALAAPGSKGSYFAVCLAWLWCMMAL